MESQQSPPHETKSQLPSNEDWIRLYQDWVRSYTNRLPLYTGRIDAAWDGLKKEMALWEQILDSTQEQNYLIHHHVVQFQAFAREAYDILVSQQRQADSMEKEDFRGLVVGVLTAQWLLLRSVVVQRVAGCPYLPRYLFSLGLPFAKELDNGALSLRLREEFQHQGNPLSTSVAQVEVNQAGRNWSIIDGNKLYAVWHINQTLNVYADSLGLYLLDEIAKDYYLRLRTVLLPILKENKDKLDQRYRDNPLVGFAPLVHLGNLAELTVFNRRMPLMISIPFGALPGMTESDKIRMSIPHEVGHAVFAQIPELIDEIKQKVKQQFDEANMSRQQQVLYTMALNWTEEICADLIGTALAGENYALSARWIMASSDTTLGVTDGTHPPSLMRPIIHLLALGKIEQKAGYQLFENVRQELQKQIAQVDASLLNRQFKSIPALMFVKMETISNVLTDLVQRILEVKLSLLGDLKVGELLVRIAETKIVSPSGEPTAWGKIPDNEREEFVLDFPTTPLAPTYATPGVSSSPICCYVSFLKDICC